MLFEDYEEFTDAQRKILEKYVTNTRGPIFALHNLPEVIKGALFSAIHDRIWVCGLYY